MVSQACAHNDMASAWSSSGASSTRRMASAATRSGASARSSGRSYAVAASASMARVSGCPRPSSASRPQRSSGTPACVSSSRLWGGVQPIQRQAGNDRAPAGVGPPRWRWGVPTGEHHHDIARQGGDQPVTYPGVDRRQPFVPVDEQDPWALSRERLPVPRSERTGRRPAGRPAIRRRPRRRRSPPRDRRSARESGTGAAAWSCRGRRRRARTAPAELRRRAPPRSRRARSGARRRSAPGRRRRSWRCPQAPGTCACMQPA